MIVVKNHLYEIRKSIEREHKKWARQIKRKYGILPPDPEKFWKQRKKKKYEHICKYSIRVLRKRHRDRLSKIKDYESAVRVGTLIMGDFYLNGFASRSCCARMAELVDHGTDYLDFYCGEIAYYRYKVEETLSLLAEAPLRKQGDVSQKGIYSINDK